MAEAHEGEVAKGEEGAGRHEAGGETRERGQRAPERAGVEPAEPGERRGGATEPDGGDRDEHPCLHEPEQHGEQARR